MFNTNIGNELVDLQLDAEHRDIDCLKSESEKDSQSDSNNVTLNGNNIDYGINEYNEKKRMKYIKSNFIIKEDEFEDNDNSGYPNWMINFL